MNRLREWGSLGRLVKELLEGFDTRIKALETPPEGMSTHEQVTLDHETRLAALEEKATAPAFVSGLSLVPPVDQQLTNSYPIADGTYMGGTVEQKMEDKPE